MEVIFLGYSDLDFNAKDGTHIDGVKVYYYFKSASMNYFGYQVGSYFIVRSNQDLIDQVKSLKPLCKANINMGFNGKKAFMNSIVEIS